ncbi:MAG: acylneuraminate cytidylyltransferase family protein [Bauldia sp.]|nr:acylneuraminate cytidylyltransferase family protein [Bauldia sp.]
MTRICTICARGGSKGVRGKNVADLAGRPMIAWSIAQAKETGLFAAVAVDSDSDAILAAARDAGADMLIRRPAALATDDAPKLAAIRHALEGAMAETGLTPEVLVDLDATAPLRIAADIVGAVALLERTGCTSVVTGAPARRSPYFNLVEERPDGTVGLSKPGAGIVRRQDAPRAFDMNASIYVWNVARFLAAPAVFYPDTRLYEMPEERSIDVDSELDFAIVRFLMAQRGAPS